MLERLLAEFVAGNDDSFEAFKTHWKRLRFGEVHFLHTLQKSFSLYHANQRSALARQRLDTAFRTLLRTTSFTFSFHLYLFYRFSCDTFGSIETNWCNVLLVLSLSDTVAFTEAANQDNNVSVQAVTYTCYFF